MAEDNLLCREGLISFPKEVEDESEGGSIGAYENNTNEGSQRRCGHVVGCFQMKAHGL